ncbi:hypothetical protein CDAR_560331, partial [Caerostris darwini]
KSFCSNVTITNYVSLSQLPNCIKGILYPLTVYFKFTLGD